MGWTLPNIVADLGGAVEAHAHPLVSDLGGVTHTPPHADHDTRSGSATAPTASIYQRAKNWAENLDATEPYAKAVNVGTEVANTPIPDEAAKLLPKQYQPLAKEVAIPPELRVRPEIAKSLANYLESKGYHKSANALRAYAGVEEGGTDFIHSMESPTSLAMAYSGSKLLDMGVAGRVLDRLIAGGFSIQSLHDAYKNASDVAKAIESGDYEQAARAMTTYFGGVGFAGAMMAGAVEPKPRAAWETAPQEEIQPERPALPSGEDKEISLKPGQYRIVPETPKTDISASGPEWERQIVARKNGKVVGGVGYKVDPEGRAQTYGAVVSPDYRNQGIATNMYEHYIRDSKAGGAKWAMSDSTGVSEPAKGVWRKLAAKGYPVQEITHPNGMSGFAIDLGQLDLKTAEPPTTTFGEDSNGRYATASDLPAHVRVYVPDRLQGDDAIKYADEKLNMQRQFLATRQKSAPRNSGIPEVSQGANDYNATQNRSPVVASNEPIDAEFGKRTADAYSLMEHNPSDPRVQRSYAAFKQGVKNQWDYATKVLGIQFEPTTEDPYKGGTLSPSQEMEADVRDNHHLSFYTLENLPSDHPLTEVDPETGLTYNQMFRAVHDLFGHAAHGNQFGPTGERNAYLDHAQMFSHAAIPALTAETHGQNSWVNFGNHLRNAEGNIPKKGEPGYIPPKERPFAQTKAGWFPRRFQTQPTLHPDLQAVVDKYGITNRADKVMQGASFITPDGKFIPLGAITHPEAIETLTGERPKEDKETLGEKLSQNWEPTHDSRVRFLNETGAIRVRASNDRAGKTLHFSVPAEGVTPEQLESMRRLVSQQGRYGNVVLERADVTPETADILSRQKEFARPSDVEDMLHEIAAHPETKDTANLMLKKGLPKYYEGGSHIQIPSYLLGPQMGTTESTVGHEYGHVLEAALRNAGRPLDGILSHLHPDMHAQNALGGIALGAGDELTKDVLEYGRKDGLQKLGSNGLPHYRNALDRFLAGGVVEDEYYDVPWETNAGKADDVAKAIRLLQSVGLDSPRQWAAEIEASHDRIRHDLQISGMRDIFMKYASSREEGLSPEYHASLNRLENFVNEVKNHYEIQKGPQTLANRGRLPQIGSPTPAGETNVGERRGTSGLAGGGKAEAEPGAGKRNAETVGGEQLSLLKSGAVAAEPEEKTSTWIPAAIDAMKESPAGAIDPRTGKMATAATVKNDGLTHGVEVFPEARALRQSLDHPPTAEDLQDFYDENEAIFQKHPELSVGWDKTDDSWELNVAARGTEAGARYVGNKLDQRAAWNIAKGEELPLNGKGEETDFSHYPLEQRLEDLKNPPDLKTPKGSTTPLLKEPIPTKGKDEGLFAAKPNPLHKGIEIQKPIYAEFQKAIGKWTQARAGDAKAGKELQRSIDIAHNEINHWIMENGGEGSGWYKRKTNAAMDILKDRHPSLDDPTKQAIFKIAWAAHSYGNDPDQNMNEASQNYARYERNGKFDYTKSAEKNWSGHTGNKYTLAKGNWLIGQQGEKGAVDFLLTKHTWPEIQNAFKDSGLNVSKKGIVLDDDGKTYGAMAFGPKGGAFYLNLNGITDHITVDVWGARALRRWEGRADDPDTLKHDKETDLWQDTAPTPAEIQRFHTIMTKVAAKLGIDRDDAQALQWYYEHRLYEVHGVGEEARDYEQAAKNVIESERKTIEALTRHPIRSRNDAGESGQPEKEGQHAFFGRVSEGNPRSGKGNPLKQILGQQAREK